MVRGQYVQLQSLDLNGIRQDNAKAVVVQGATCFTSGSAFPRNVDEIVIRNGELLLRTDADH